MAARVVALLIVALPAAAWARVVQVPEGGRAVPVAAQGVACGPLPAGWTLESQGTPEARFVRPAPGAVPTIDVQVAAKAEDCGQSKETVTVIAIAPLPEIDPAGVVLFPDDGRVELRGQRLLGVQVRWEAGGKSGQDLCLEPTAAGKVQQCVVPIGQKVPADAALTWIPVRGRHGEDVVTYDSAGNRVDPSHFVLRPARTILSTMFPVSGAVDVSQGAGRVPLVHPEVVSSVDCGQATCEVSEGSLVVWGVPATAGSVSVRVRLVPRVFFARANAMDAVVAETLPLFRCQLAIASGPPLRDADDSQIVVRMDQQDQRCGKDLRLHWIANGEPVDIIRTIKAKDAVFIQLRVGRITSERLMVLATKGETEATTIAFVTAKTVAAPRPRTTLELPKWGKIEFIPTNRDALLTVAGAGERARFVPLAVEGAYAVSGIRGGSFLVRGDANAGGFVSLRFAFRVDGLPPELADADIGVVSEHVQRAVREASVPAPLGASAEGAEPLMELLCADAKGNTLRLAPSQPHRIPFESRDSCRVVIHRERLKPEYGQQEIILEVDVTKADGSSRPESHLSERMVLSPGGESRIIPLRGGTEQFDYIVVRVSHILDETRYALNPLARNGVPAAQWSVIVEGGRFRIYASASIPAGLNRVNQPSGQLTLNFGLLARLTALDPHGKERLLGLEFGMMGVGLIQSPGAIQKYPPTLAAVSGVGLRVPLGGGAAVSMHLWLGYEFRDGFDYAPDASKPMDLKRAPHWMFIFGPSIEIGNIGKNL